MARKIRVIHSLLQNMHIASRSTVYLAGAVWDFFVDALVPFSPNKFKFSCLQYQVSFWGIREHNNMASWVHSYRIFLLQQKNSFTVLPLVHPFRHWPAFHVQLRVQCLGRGLFDTWTKRKSNQTANLEIFGWTAISPEPPFFPTYINSLRADKHSMQFKCLFTKNKKLLGFEDDFRSGQTV